MVRRTMASLAPSCSNIIASSTSAANAAVNMPK
jgi:hypothetical protein